MSVEKNVKLQEIADIKLGYQFRSKINTDIKGKYRIIVMKNVRDDNTIDYDSLSSTDIDDIKDSFLVSKGDILLVNKGFSNRAVLIDRELDNVIATTHFFIIRIKNHQTLLPKYLSWYLNQKPTQKYIAKYSMGTAIKHITCREVENLKVTIPDLATQKKICDIYRLNNRENEIVNKIQKMRNDIVKQVLLNTITIKSD